MKYCVDIDGTICSPITGRNYEEAKPWQDKIDVINKLYDDGHTIIYFTARGMGRFDGDGQKAHEAFYDLTYNQLKSWGCKFDKLHMGKFHAHYFIDDKGINSEDFFG
jgi:uncharacterized HAD superfamily protein